MEGKIDRRAHFVTELEKPESRMDIWLDKLINLQINSVT